ncbi:MAG: hypothetical protein ACJAY8_000003 [Sphingobacteriales bacterium]|jgi:hypothetical protein
MKKIVYSLSALFLLVSSVSYAGNPDRAGSAGAGELLLNPWAKSSGMGFAAASTIRGAEAMFLNVAGLAFTKKTDIVFSSSNHLSGSGIKINAVALGKKVGESGTIGIAINSFSLGDIDITTAANPEGNIGTYSPALTNFTLAYAKEFSNSIYGGIAVKMITESISNSSGSGVAFDAGIQYLTGAQENIHFGISLKNVGPPMTLGGDGLSKQVIIDEKELTTNQRADKFELPSLINIGGAYDIIFPDDKHVLTVAGNFTSNSFTNDQRSVGLNYAFNSRFEARFAYTDEDNINGDDAQTAFGPMSFGASVNLPVGETSIFSFDYSYRETNTFSGTHSLGVRIWLQ